MQDEIKINLYDHDNDTEQSITVPSIVAVCERCGGMGKHTNPSIDGNGITQSEMYELGEEFQQNYFNGVYDVPCEVCNGLRVVRVIDWSTFEYNQPKIAKAYTEQQRQEAFYAAEQAAELRHCGQY